MNKIDEIMTNEVVPLSIMQFNFTTLVKCNTYLTYAKIVELGCYQKSDLVRVKIPPHSKEEAGKHQSTPISPTATSSDDDGNNKSQVTNQCKGTLSKMKERRMSKDMDDKESPSDKIHQPAKVASPNLANAVRMNWTLVLTFTKKRRS